MLEHKYHPYFTDKKDKTKNGYEYMVLSSDIPEKLLDEYKQYLASQDDLIAKGERVVF